MYLNVELKFKFSHNIFNQSIMFERWSNGRILASPMTMVIELILGATRKQSYRKE
jgi:hypothetical protein